MKNPRLLALYLAITCAIAAVVIGQQSAITGQSQTVGAAAITPDALRTWLTYLASDELEGRNTFSEGLALAGAYISQQLKDANVRPGGDRGSYFQRVSVLGVRSMNRSTLTVEVNGESRTFMDGEGITFPSNVGAKRTLIIDQVDFVGYGLNMGSNYNSYKGRDVKGKAVVWLGNRAPRSASQGETAPFMLNRVSTAIDDMGAAATIAPPREGGGRGAGRGGRGGPNAPDFTTVGPLDLPQPPKIDATDEFFDYLFSASEIKYADLKEKSEALEDLPNFTLKGVKLSFNLDADYQIISTQYTRNVVGIVDGTDPQLRDTYVAFGAHYDHVGYIQGELASGADRIFNGADDDGSGTATLIGLARAFAFGPRPRRSLLFVWHAGEEKGLWGSEYFADHPEVPLDRIVAQLNMDMIGRNRDNNESESNTVLAVGADRISTELHNILVDANASFANPLKIDFGMNDPSDPERIYYRSDHFSYAAKGIPVIFFFTGLHPDYHRVTDTVDKIKFDKMARIGQLVYETGRRLANLDHPPVRDFKGPRMGKGASGKINAGK